MRRLVAAVMFAAVSGGGEAQADPSSEINWLMSKPLSLFDHGIINLRKSASEAAETIQRNYSVTAFSDVDYDYDKNTIEVEVTVLDFEGVISQQECKGIREKYIKYMIWLPSNFEDDISEAVRKFMNIKFSHSGGYVESGRPKSIGEKLRDSTVVKLNYQGKSGDQAIRYFCEGPINKLNTPSLKEQK